jgi:hypothetical protein
MAEPEIDGDVRRLTPNTKPLQAEGNAACEEQAASPVGYTRSRLEIACAVSGISGVLVCSSAEDSPDASANLSATPPAASREGVGRANDAG